MNILSFLAKIHYFPLYGVALWQVRDSLQRLGEGGGFAGVKGSDQIAGQYKPKFTEHRYIPKSFEFLCMQKIFLCSQFCSQDELDQLTLQLKVASGKTKPSVLKNPPKTLATQDV